MGTLFEQKPRGSYSALSSEVLFDVREIMRAEDISFDQALKLLEVAEIRRKNELFIADGDAWDEQAAEFGHIINDLNRNVCEIVNKLNEDI